MVPQLPDGADSPASAADLYRLIGERVLMLRHLNEDAAADRVMRGVTTVLAGATRTRDIGGTASTSEFADAICRAMEADAQ